MRAQTLLLLALLGPGCSHEVPGTSGFGDGSGGDGPGAGTEDAGPAGDESAPATAGDGNATDSETNADTVDGGGSMGTADGSAGASEATADDDGGSTTGQGAGSDDAASGTASDTDTGLESGSESETGAVENDACGYPLDGPWLEIEYSQAGASATSPGWEYSPTAGWGETEWAAQGESWPEVWDLFQNIDVDNDPIGVVATVGSSGTWQLMLGLQDLADYDSATVCVEGRSVSASASVQFDVYNPLNDCGGSATMAHDWNMHAEGVELGTCFVPGGGVQAVRIETTGGSGALGIKRVRVILHGAVY